VFRNPFRNKHSANTLALVTAAFPPELREDVLIVMGRLEVANTEPHATVQGPIRVGADSVAIPSRVYFPKADQSALSGLTPRQSAILAAVMTLHNSGYQRELWSVHLCSYPCDWAAPFVALLLGDYVRDIAAALEAHISEEWALHFHCLLSANPELQALLTARIVNYWGAYYRLLTPNLNFHPPYRVGVRMGVWDKRIAPRLTIKAEKTVSASHSCS